LCRIGRLALRAIMQQTIRMNRTVTFHFFAVAALHQGAPVQMTWLEDPPPWLKPWLKPWLRST